MPGGSELKRTVPFFTKVVGVLVAALTVFWLARTIYGQVIARHEIGDLTVHTVTPLQGQPDSVAISPDGSSVSMMHRDPSNGAITDRIEIREVESGRTLGSIALPVADWKKGPQYSLREPLRYCDDGRYLLAFNGLNVLHVFDAHTYQLHTSIALNDLKVLQGNGGVRGLSEVQSAHTIQISCAALTGTAALRLQMDNTGVFKVFDLESGTETADLTASFKGIWGNGIAVSPDGTRVAAAVWDRSGAEVIQVVDARTGTMTRQLPFGVPRGTERYLLAFAGDDAVVIGRPACERTERCQLQSGRVVRLLNLGTGAVKELGAAGREAYRFTAASADGREVFAYTGAESFCQSCNRKLGEMRIDDARFTVWERDSGKVLVQSPQLRVQVYKCPLLMLGPCEDLETVPELAMSANGKAAVSLWHAERAGGGGGSEGMGEVKVFAWR